ncbi:MAG TPA: chitobiase/beta-hexosaminidase C-terminal domain-containing protein, partial [Armatimonadota bacterium]|nr:chitobiase/beta-hexosaminidase C-terminal domain-containing protein [Armatimonadota bacterium]
LPIIGYCTEEEGMELPVIGDLSWSPDSQHIAFSTDRGTGENDIWLIHPDGTGLEPIVIGSFDEFGPGWSPDSSAIYFLSNRTGNGRLWKKNLTTGALTQVFDKALGGYAISHGGDLIAVEVHRETSWGVIIISAATGEELRWLATNAYSPSWSPDDRKISFLRRDNLWVINNDRSDLQQITNFTEDDPVIGSVDWGSSGFIAFTQNGRIYKIRTDGSGLTCIYQDADIDGWAESPVWSPNGSRLAFIRHQWDAVEIWAINTDGTGLTQITHTVATPTFSPEGGEYTGAQTVTIGCATPGAVIRYTTDGTDPTESSPIYSSPVTVDASKILKAKAWKTDYFPSFTASADYVIQ